MSPSTRITTPSALALLAAEITSSKSQQTQQIQLVLLEALKQASTFTTSRAPDTRYSRGPDGSRKGVTNNEYLDITALGKAWRQEWV